MKVIPRALKGKDVFLDIIYELEKKIVGAPHLNSEMISRSNIIVTLITYFLWNFLNLKITLLIKYFSLKKEEPNEIIFGIIMGNDFLNFFPYCYYPGEKNIYMYDAWKKHHKKIIRFAIDFDIKNIYLTSSQAASLLQPHLKNTKCHWVAEGIDPASYSYKPYSKKTIDVLAFGRRYDNYHNSIVNKLETANINYIYTAGRGHILFPDRKKFIAALSKSKISICFPSSLTHPQRSGDIEVMTLRYLQSIAAKCLILGTAPKEMLTLFGYNPVVEVDHDNAGEQILSILESYEDYIPLIENNYSNLIKYHSWNNRLETII
jgi:hypothetical protein